MPGGDRTGPRGMGPMTGRAAGYCAGFAGAGYEMGRGRGRGGYGGQGYGQGFGRGRMGRPNFPVANNVPVPDQEKQMLINQISDLQGELADIKKCLRDMASDRAGNA